MSLLSVLSHLLHLPLQLLRLPPQHLLLPSLLERRRSLLLLLRQLLLPSRQRIELLQRIIHLLRLLLRSRSRLRRLVLVLLRIQLQVEQARQIATCAAAATSTTAAPLLSKRHLNLPERSLRPQQILQRLLLSRHRIAPLRLLQLVRRRLHRRSRTLHVLLKAVELLIRSRKVPALHPSRERQHLLPQLVLHIREELARIRSLLRRSLLIVLLLPGSRDQLLLPPAKYPSGSPAPARLRHRRLHRPAATARTPAQTDPPG